MGNKFDFKLHEELWMFEDDETTIFHAELINGGYYVTWDESDAGATYTIKEVKEYITDGEWIVYV